MLILVLVLLGVTVAAAPVASGMMGRNAGWLLACPLLLGAGMAATAFEAGEPHTEVHPWISSLGVDFAVRLDGLSLVFLMLVLIIGAGVLMYSTRYLHHKDTTFYIFMAGFAASMAMLVTTDSMVVMYVAWEFTTLCSYFLIANSGEKGRQPAIRTLLVTVLGGLFLLTAVTVMVMTTGSMRLSEVLANPVWVQRPGLTAGVAILVALAAFTKSAQFPFQAWLPDSMVAIAPVSAYLHAAAMVKAGIYLILRFSPMFHEVRIWNILLICVGGFTAAFGAMTAVRRDDLKELLAYSTMSQLGLLVLTVGIGTDAAITAAIVHTIAHATFKAALFMSVGIVEHECGTRSFAELRRREVKMPVTKAIVALSACSMAGVPLLFGFVSKEGLIDAGLTAALPESAVTIVVGAVVFTSMFTFAYSLRYIIGVFGAPAEMLKARRDAGEETISTTEASPTFWAIPALLAASTLVLGLAPSILNSLVSYAAAGATGRQYHAHLAVWHGIGTPLALSVFIICAGAVMVIFQGQLVTAMGTFTAPLKGTEAVDYLTTSLIRFSEKHFRSSVGSTSMRRHLAAPLLGIVVLAVIGVFTLGGIDPVVAERSRRVDWVFTLIVALGVIATVNARSRLTVVVVVSLTGFGMILWFYALGAADVAMTQLMVEFLTVCVLVLILHRLPDRFTPDNNRSNLWAIVLSALVGISTMLGVLALSGHREKSELANYLLENTFPETHGNNIVNVILVDFRGFDTMGELTVLGMAGVAIATLLQSNKLLPVRANLLDKFSPVYDGRNNSIFLRSAAKLIGPIIVVMSLVLFFRGHLEPGGGFIAALMGSAGFALMYLAAPTNGEARIRWPYFALIGMGVFTGALTGMVGFFVEGSFLASIDFMVFGQHQSSAIFFDFGVYLSVMGVVLGSLNMLGMPRGEDDEEETIRFLDSELEMLTEAKQAAEQLKETSAEGKLS